VQSHPGWFIWPQVILFGLSIWVTMKHLVADMDRGNLVGADKHYHRVFLEFRKEFPSPDDLVVVVESNQTEKNRQFVERLGARLEPEKELFGDVFFRGDLARLGRKSLLFVPTTNLVELERTLDGFRPFLTKFSQCTNLDAVFRMVNREFRHASREASKENEALLKALPALTQLLGRATEAVNSPVRPISPGVEALFGVRPEDQGSQYIRFDGGKIYLLTAKARSANLMAPAIERLREHVAAVQREVPARDWTRIHARLHNSQCRSPEHPDHHVRAHAGRARHRFRRSSDHPV